MATPFFLEVVHVFLSSRFYKGCILRSFLFILLTIIGISPIAYASDKVVKVGVLSFRTPAKTIERWSPTIDTLTKNIEGATFVLMPMNYADLEHAVEDQTIDFVLTNTGHYIELEANENIKGMVTLVKSIDGISTKEFGGVIFTQAHRDDINSIADLRGKTFLAVKKSSLGGFLVAWEELLENNLDPLTDFATLTYNGLPHDNIVYKILKGEADAGTVRTSVLEQMEKEGQINLADLKILNQKYTEGFPYIHSTKLYPEWPFSSLSHVDDELVEKATIVLLNIKRSNLAAVAGSYDRWVPPLDYRSVHSLFTTLNTGPYKKFTTFTFYDFIQKYLVENLIALMILVVALIFLIRIIQLNRSLKRALSEVQSLQKIIPICMLCKKVKDDEGYWGQVEAYISKHSEAEFSHGYCPQCYEKEMAKIDDWDQK